MTRIAMCYEQKRKLLLFSCFVLITTSESKVMVLILHTRKDIRGTLRLIYTHAIYCEFYLSLQSRKIAVYYGRAIVMEHLSLHLVIYFSFYIA